MELTDCISTVLIFASMNLVPYRVLNTIGLRVIDASIFPLIPNANINVPAMATGCQGADFMLEQWNLQ